MSELDAENRETRARSLAAIIGRKRAESSMMSGLDTEVQYTMLIHNSRPVGFEIGIFALTLVAARALVFDLCQ